MVSLYSLARHLRRFYHEDDGVITVNFMIVFPIFMVFFLMTFENGMISLRHVMLERGVDLAVRNMRLGLTDAELTRNGIRDLICDYATSMVPDCANQMSLEMIRMDPRNWANAQLRGQVECVDRGDPGKPPTTSFVGGNVNNELIVVRVCARFDPMMPTTGIGRAINQANSNAAADGSYALITTASYVVEPVR